MYIEDVSRLPQLILVSHHAVDDNSAFEAKGGCHRNSYRDARSAAMITAT